MIYCASCGSPNPAGQVVCEVCGAELPPPGATPPGAPTPPTPPGPSSTARSASAPRPSPSDGLPAIAQVGVFVGSLCLSPLLGVVLYYVWRDRDPGRASQTCTLTRWAFAVWVGFFVLGVVAGIVEGL